jgi:hypothetical protein
LRGRKSRSKCEAERSRSVDLTRLTTGYPNGGNAAQTRRSRWPSELAEIDDARPHRLDRFMIGHVDLDP